MDPLSYKRLDFEEFCAAAISVYQLEVHPDWDKIATAAFDYFDEEGNRVISLEELAQVCTFFLRAHLPTCVNFVLKSMKQPT
jgi:Ca2+-binding EF-hand superfamily protein